MPEAHASLGFLTMWYDWDFLKAERELLRAIELNPNLATAHHWYSYTLMLLERTDEALAQMRHALTLDPLSLVITTDIGELLYRQRRYQEAIAQCQKARDLDPQFGMAIFWQLLCYLQLNADDAISILNLCATNLPHQYRALTVAHAKAGNPEHAQRHWQMLQQMTERQYVPPGWSGSWRWPIWAKKTRRLPGLKPLVRTQRLVAWLKQDPLADTLRTDPRFSDLLRRIGLQP
ncbi:MAG: tetratricopeptide repeat protein [Acidobacteriota bacterium]